MRSDYEEGRRDGFWAGVIAALLLAVLTYLLLLAGRSEGAPAPLERRKAQAEPFPVGSWLVTHRFRSDAFTARMRFRGDGTFDVTHEGSSSPDYSGRWRIERGAGAVWLDYDHLIPCPRGLSFTGDRFEYPYGTITRDAGR